MSYTISKTAWTKKYGTGITNTYNVNSDALVNPVNPANPVPIPIVLPILRSVSSCPLWHSPSEPRVPNSWRSDLVYLSCSNISTHCSNISQQPHKPFLHILPKHALCFWCTNISSTSLIYDEKGEHHCVWQIVQTHRRVTYDRHCDGIMPWSSRSLHYCATDSIAFNCILPDSLNSTSQPTASSFTPDS